MTCNIVTGGAFPLINWDNWQVNQQLLQTWRRMLCTDMNVLFRVIVSIDHYLILYYIIHVDRQRELSLKASGRQLGGMRNGNSEECNKWYYYRIQLWVQQSSRVCRLTPKTSLHSFRLPCTSQTAAAAGGGILQRSSNAIKLPIVPHSGLKLLSGTNSESPSPTVAVWGLSPS